MGCRLVGEAEGGNVGRKRNRGGEGNLRLWVVFGRHSLT